MVSSPTEMPPPTEWPSPYKEDWEAQATAPRHPGAAHTDDEEGAYPPALSQSRAVVVPPAAAAPPPRSTDEAAEPPQPTAVAPPPPSREEAAEPPQPAAAAPPRPSAGVGHDAPPPAVVPEPQSPEKTEDSEDDWGPWHRSMIPEGATVSGPGPSIVPYPTASRPVEDRPHPPSESPIGRRGTKPTQAPGAMARSATVPDHRRPHQGPRASGTLQEEGDGPTGPAPPATTSKYGRGPPARVLPVASKAGTVRRERIPVTPGITPASSAHSGRPVPERPRALPSPAGHGGGPQPLPADFTPRVDLTGPPHCGPLPAPPRSAGPPGPPAAPPPTAGGLTPPPSTKPPGAGVRPRRRRYDKGPNSPQQEPEQSSKRRRLDLPPPTALQEGGASSSAARPPRQQPPQRQAHLAELDHAEKAAARQRAFTTALVTANEILERGLSAAFDFSTDEEEGEAQNLVDLSIALQQEADQRQSHAAFSSEEEAATDDLDEDNLAVLESAGLTVSQPPPEPCSRGRKNQ